MTSIQKLLAIVAIGLAAFTSTSAEGGTSCHGPARLSFRGHWASHCNGHHGLLKATVHPRNCDVYRVRFSGTFLGVVPFVYSTPMTVTGHSCNGDTHLYAHSRLPLFGEFTCHATMNDSHFSARYVSRRDEGHFTMCRR